MLRRFLPFWDLVRYHFPMKILFLLALLVAGCGKQESSKTYPLKDKAVEKYVNQMSLPADPNLTLDKSIINTSYRIQIALYKDGKFYYDLPTLGDGTGTWKKRKDFIELKAKRSLFDMYIEIRGNDKEGESVLIQFTDRFGPNTLKMNNINIF